MNYASYVSLLSLNVLLLNGMGADKSNLLTQPFNVQQYQSYKVFITGHNTMSHEQSERAMPAPVADSFPWEDEIVYANMVLKENLPLMYATKQIPPQLFSLLQRFAMLSADSRQASAVNRFESLLNVVVTKAVELSIAPQLAQMQTELKKAQSTATRWQVASEGWQNINKSVLQNLAQVREEKEKFELAEKEKSAALQQQNADLQAQLERTQKSLSETGYELWICDGQKNGLQAENHLLREQLAKAKKELAEAKKTAHKKSSQNGRLKVQIRALQHVSK